MYTGQRLKMIPYNPKLDDSTINNGKRDSEKTSIKVALAIVATVIVFISIVFFAVHLVLQSITPQQEQDLFSLFDRATDGKTVTNEEMKSIFIKAGATSFLKMKIVCDKNLNAFALPGGTVILTSKLLQDIHTEEGMAFVLGHEVGHVQQRDHLRGAARALTFLVVDMFTGMSRWPGVSFFFQLLDGAYSREQELAADKIALQQMRSSYGRTAGGDEFFVAIQNTLEDKINKTFWFASTHPLTEDRLSYFEKQNKDFLLDVPKIRRRDLFDQVLCESGCHPELCGKERTETPKSDVRKKFDPISLKDF